MSSKWCCVLAVVCLSVILLSLDADTQPTVDDESSQCGSASLQQVENMVSVIALNQQEMMEDVKRLVLSRPTECECATVKPTEYSTYPSVTTSKEQLVSALVCEYAV